MKVHNMERLLDIYGETTPHLLGRRFYKDTECGVFTNFIMKDDRKVYYDDDEASDINAIDDIKAIQVGSIVEGSESMAQGFTMEFPFYTAVLDLNLADVEAAADEMWEEANLG